MKLTYIQHEILIGTILGHACVQWNKNKTKARICFRQKNKAYLDHLYEVFKDFIQTPPQINKITGVWQCDTLPFPVFRFYRQQFYNKEGRKVLPRLIHRWLTPRAIAYWYMDDGALKRANHSSGIRFCTDCFRHEEVRSLTQTLTRIYGVGTSTFRQRENLRIYIGGKNSNDITFGRLFLPYIHPSMEYKIPVEWKVLSGDLKGS